MTHKSAIILLAIGMLSLNACSNKNDVSMPEGKTIFIPEDMKGMNLQDPNSEWSYHRMECTENMAIFWQKGFGESLATPPDLEGKPMKVDLENLKNRLETFYSFYRDTLHFTYPNSAAERTRMMVMLHYSLEGTAYGGTYDDSIGALWIAPNRVQDEKLNCIAHELGHSFQCQIGADRPEGEWQAYGFYEMASQWMLWQVNPDWLTDENYHFEAFRQLTHRAFLHPDNVYHSPYVLQYWSDVRGRDVIGELFRMGQNGEDALMVYKRICNLSQQQMCDEMFEACRHIVGLDFRHAWRETRQYAGQLDTPVEKDRQGWTMPAKEFIPQNYGFNVFPVSLQGGPSALDLSFEGLTSHCPSQYRSRAGWRYGFVAETADGKYDYSEMGTSQRGKLRYNLPANTLKVWLVVMGAPTVHEGGSYLSEEMPLEEPHWPYRFKL